MMKPVPLARSVYTRGRTTLTISAAQIDKGRFEVAALLDPGDTLELLPASSEEVALQLFDQLIDRYAANFTVRKITKKMQALIDALHVAKLEAIAVCNMDDDGGTCNFDSPALELPKWAAADVEVCAKAAGLRCFTWKPFGRRMWVFTVPEPCGQGDNRTRMAEAMSASLKKSGFDAGMYYRMD